MQIEVDVKCMKTNFGGHSLSGFGNTAACQNWPKFPFGPWTIYSPWGSKNRIGSKNLCKSRLM